MAEKNSTYGAALALCAECPDRQALVLSYESTHSAVPLCGDEEIWKLVCDRCGAAFHVLGDELLVRPVPVSWLVDTPSLANCMSGARSSAPKRGQSQQLRQIR